MSETGGNEKKQDDDHVGTGKRSNEEVESEDAADDGSSNAKKKAKKVDYAAELRGAMLPSESVAKNLQLIYAKYREIVGPPETVDGQLKCSRCDELYKESQNHETACYKMKSFHDDDYTGIVHKGLYWTDYSSDFWYGWHEANNPMESSYWKSQRGGGYKWTGCGCTENCQDECERVGRHYPDRYPPSDDEWCEEASAEDDDGDFDMETSKREGQKSLVEDYIRGLVDKIDEKLHDA